MKNKKKIFIIPIIITILKMVFVIPVHITGGFAGVDEDGYVSLFGIIASKDENIIDGFWYEIITQKYILEGIAVFAVAMLITYIIYKLLNKKGK